MITVHYDYILKDNVRVTESGYFTIGYGGYIDRDITSLSNRLDNVSLDGWISDSNNIGLLPYKFENPGRIRIFKDGTEIASIGIGGSLFLHNPSAILYGVGASGETFIDRRFYIQNAQSPDNIDDAILSVQSYFRQSSTPPSYSLYSYGLNYSNPNNRDLIFEWLRMYSTYEPSQPSKLITRLSINIDFPNAGQPLATTATATVDVEDVDTSVTSITWEPSDADAEQLTEYKATVTISADGGRFNSGIEPVVVDTGETSTTYVQGVSRPVFDPETPSVITYTISFGPTGIKDPYEVDRDEESEKVEDPDTPSLSGVSTHFISLYEPSESQIRALASYMWTDDFIENLKKVVNDPFQTILGLSILPVTAPTSGSGSVILGNVDTGISMPKVSSQYVKLNCGTVTVEERYRSYLDYNPYTKIWLYLPYIGIQSIDTDSIMGTSLSVSYTVDVLSGACIANVISNGSIIGTYAGMCASQLPVTAGQYGSMVSGIFQAVGGIAQAIAGAGTGNYAAAIAGGVNAVQGATTAAKVTVDKSGKLGSTSGLMGVQYPFLIIERPRQAQPTSQNHYTGYPSFMTLTVGNLKGYSEIANIDLSGISATQKERDELLNLLNTGVYF